jgi:hypothetical protein
MTPIQSFSGLFRALRAGVAFARRWCRWLRRCGSNGLTGGE